MAWETLSYPQWKAPSEDGQILIWPDAPALLSQTRDNHARLDAAGAIVIQNVPLPDLRRQMRQWLGHADDQQLLVATGHQTELYHPGVWTKIALINALASAVDGQAYHFAVDTDEPKHLSIRFPGGNEPLTDDPLLATAAWSGMLSCPTPAHLRHLEERLAAAAGQWDFQPMLGSFLQSIRRLTLESTNLSAVLTNGLHELDWQLGLRHHAMITSPLWSAPPYVALVHHVLSRAQEFAGHYNAALADFRRENGLKGNTRPMPDLRIGQDVCEAPFWLDDLATGRRRRAAVVGRNGVWRLALANGQEFVFDASADGRQAAESLSLWLRQNSLRLSPRALTLTMFLRLLVVDQFVHGIGGGRYDQVLDRLIFSHFGLEPPRFSVTTGTLYFPTALSRPRACIPCLMQEGRRLKHSLLGERKMVWVKQIAALPRRSLQRSTVFHDMHNNLEAAALTHPALQRWEEHLIETERQSREDELLFDRELFYPLQPKGRLEGVIERYGAAVVC